MLPRESLGDSCGVAACGLWTCRHVEVHVHPRRATPNIEMVPVLLKNGGRVDVGIHEAVGWIGGQGHHAPEVCHKHAVESHP